MKLQLLNKGSTYKFTEGEYLIGKGNDCDLIIEGPATKDAPVRLIVTAKEVLLSSLDQSEAIDYLGVPVANIAFDRDFKVTINDETIFGTVVKEKRLNIKNIKLGNVLQTLTTYTFKNDIRVIASLMIAIFVVLTYLFVRMPSNGRFDDFKTQEVIKRGILLARYLAEVNRGFIIDGAFNKMRVTPISLEEGVRYAYLVNAEGHLLAPIEKADGQFNRELVKELQAREKLTVAEGQSGEKIILYPIASVSGIVGAAIIGYDVGYADNLPVPTGGLISLITLFLLIVLSVLAGLWISRLFLTQIGHFNDEVNVAIKNSARQLTLETPYSEMSNLLVNINRLLAGKSMNELNIDSKSISEQKEAELTTEANLDSHQIPIPGFIRDMDNAWCLLNIQDYQVSDWNEHFKKRYTKSGAISGDHLVEVLENVKIVNAISSFINDPSLSNVKVDDETPLILSKVIYNEYYSFIIFEEQDGNHSSGSV